MPFNEENAVLAFSANQHMIFIIKYYDANQSVISGWPAVVGVIEWDNSPEAGYNAGKYLAIGYIYVGDYKIGFSSDYDDENALEALKHSKITAEPGLDLHFLDSEGNPIPKDHLAKDHAECEAKCGDEYKEYCGGSQCGDTRYYNICLNNCQTNYYSATYTSIIPLNISEVVLILLRGTFQQMRRFRTNLKAQTCNGLLTALWWTNWK